MRFIGRVFLVLLLGLAVWGYFFLQAAGVFLTIPVTSPGTCVPITAGGVVGVEDIAIDREARLAYLSGYDRRADRAGKQVRGAIWVLDMATPGSIPGDATAGTLPEGFLPHGISVYVNPADGKRTVFAINHAGGRNTVEIFDQSGALLVHRRTVSGPELLSPNDVVGVGPDAFYVTNDHANVSGWMRTVEEFGRLQLSTVQFLDGSKFSTAITDIGGSNGINVSADGRSLYLSAALERTVYVYDRDPSSNSLVRRAAIPVPGFADNIDVLANGDLLLGLHTKILDFLAHVGDASKRSPSHIMLLKADGKGSFVPQTIYYNPGDEISAASVGAAADGRLLIGPIFEQKVLSCEWTAPH